jgi:hypothetical protein
MPGENPVVSNPWEVDIESHLALPWVAIHTSPRLVLCTQYALGTVTIHTRQPALALGHEYSVESQSGPS